MSASQAENAGSIPVPRFKQLMTGVMKFFRERGLSFLIIFCFLSGCVTSGKSKPIPAEPATLVTQPQPKPEGIYHKVQKGETVWRIAKTYNVSLDEVVKVNNIPNAASIEENQLLFIPGVKEIKQIIQKTPEIKKDEFFWPIKGRVLSYFNDSNGSLSNRGIDVEAADGENVKASREGVVVLADYISGYGYTLILDHEDGYYPVYAHNAQLLVKLNDHVLRSEAIAKAGKNGKASFVHFEIRQGKQAFNPLHYLP